MTRPIRSPRGRSDTGRQFKSEPTERQITIQHPDASAPSVRVRLHVRVEVPGKRPGLQVRVRDERQASREFDLSLFLHAALDEAGVSSKTADAAVDAYSEARLEGMRPLWRFWPCWPSARSSPRNVFRRPSSAA